MLKAVVDITAPPMIPVLVPLPVLPLPVALAVPVPVVVVWPVCDSRNWVCC